MQRYSSRGSRSVAARKKGSDGGPCGGEAIALRQWSMRQWFHSGRDFTAPPIMFWR